MTHLTDTQITQAADAVLSAFEVHCDRSELHANAIEHCMDTWRIKPSKSATILIVKLVHLGWEAITIRTKKEIALNT